MQVELVKIKPYGVQIFHGRSDFREGETVYCISRRWSSHPGWSANITIGRSYKIIRVHEARDDQTVCILNDVGKERYYCGKYFRRFYF